MKVQSLSICVPTKNKCVNACEFCVSRTHTNPYEDRINKVAIDYIDSIDGSERGEHLRDFLEKTLEYKDFYNRLEFARDNGCNVVVLTGTGEPVQNMKFIEFFSMVNSKLSSPFKSIEVQTTGVMLDDSVLQKLRKCGITTMSFSISNIFDNDRNLDIIKCPQKLKFDVFGVIEKIKKYNFNLRLSLNLINDYDKYTVKTVINRCVELGADQVTFRKLYKSNSNGVIDKWIEENASEHFYYDVEDYVRKNGGLLGVLPFGAKMYNIKDMSICVDSDCMSEEPKDTYKYLILRENAKLYFRWETKSSLVF